MLVQWEELCARFGITLEIELAPRYNIAPTQSVPVVLLENGQAVCKMLRWGLVPFWAKDQAVGNKLINARAETVAVKNSFRESFRRRRCLVPADGFFEWKKEAGRKTPYLFGADHGSLVALAGLWDTWQSPAGEKVQSFTIITTEANALVAPVHNRMPVILGREAEATWLAPAYNPVYLQALLVPYPAERMTCRQVSALVNSPRNDSPDVLGLPL
jgi:putative SOS response-associated peptidase YedK